MQLRILATGSSGNCFAVRCGASLVLIDSGVPVSTVRALLAEDDLDIGDLDAILLTHEHSDHAKELRQLAKAADCPVYLSFGTWQALGGPALPERHCFDSMATGLGFQIGDLHACPTPVLHDAREPVAWILRGGDRQIGVLTDTGDLSPRLTSAFSGCHLLALEFNHDVRMLRGGSYTASLKKRIAGDRGHLNNEQAAAFLRQITLPAGVQLVAVHISENNNSPDLVRQCLQEVLPDDCQPLIMAQRQSSAWLPA